MTMDTTGSAPRRTRAQQRRLLAGGALALALVCLTGRHAHAACETHPGGAAPPPGFGASWDQFSSSKPLLLATTCPTAGTVTITAGRGNASKLVYDTIYTGENGAWVPHSLTGTRVAAGWLQNVGTVTLPAPASGTLSIIGYVCSLVSNSWQCGCADNACVTPLWQYQGLDVGPGPVDGGGGGGPVGGGGNTGVDPRCLNRPAAQIHNMPGGLNQNVERFAVPAGGGTYIWPAGSTRWYGKGDPFPSSGPMPNPQPDPRHPGGYPSNPNDNKYPVYLTTNGGLVCAIGLKVIGQQHRELFWNVLKSFYDGDGFHMQGSGEFVVSNYWVDNVEDGFAPRGPSNGGGALDTMHWKIEHAYARYNRDDYDENDAMFDGIINDVLIDGTFVFFSARPNKGGRSYSIDINKALVHMQDLPYNGDMGMHPGYDTTGNVAHAQLFKMATAGSPALTVTDSIFYIDPHTDPPPVAWAWPKGTYRNVTLVWTANKPFWTTLPAGVTLTNDLSVWTNARAAWLRDHGCDPDGDNCTWISPAMVERPAQAAQSTQTGSELPRELPAVPPVPPTDLHGNG